MELANLVGIYTDAQGLHILFGEDIIRHFALSLRRGTWRRRFVVMDYSGRIGEISLHPLRLPFDRADVVIQGGVIDRSDDEHLKTMMTAMVQYGESLGITSF